MSRIYHQIMAKAAIAAGLSVVVTLAIAETAAYFFGGSVEGTGLILCILCPLVIAGPASAWQFFQQSRLAAARDELRAAKAELERAHAALQRAYGDLNERARRDGLTGILNREGFVEALLQALESQHGTLFILDADEFKLINDRYGHPPGDEALRVLSGAVAASIDEAGLFGRIGGEEFAVFMPGIRGRAAFEAAERMRLAVRTSPVAVRSGTSISLSVSIGGAHSSNFADLEALWQAADACLYAAKADGRDRLVLNGGGPSEELGSPLLSIG